MRIYNDELSEIKKQLLVITTIKWWALPFIFPFWLILSVGTVYVMGVSIVVNMSFNLFDIVMNRITK